MTSQPDSIEQTVAPEPFTFRPEHDGSLPLETAVFQALGAASMCWDDTPTGVFDSTRAKEIGEALMVEIRKAEAPLAPFILLYRVSPGGDWRWAVHYSKTPADGIPIRTLFETKEEGLEYLAHAFPGVVVKAED